MNKIIKIIKVVKFYRRDPIWEEINTNLLKKWIPFQRKILFNDITDTFKNVHIVKADVDFHTYNRDESKRKYLIEKPYEFR